MASKQNDDDHPPQTNGVTHTNGLASLVESALARICETDAVAKLSPEAATALKDPMTTVMAHALCDADDFAAKDLVDDMIEAGVSVEDVCLSHLAPAARRLGELWEQDRLSFTEVTLASSRVQAIMRRLPLSRVNPICSSGRGALFAAVPGEEHTLGVMMAADLFRRHGWDVGLLMGQDHGELVRRIKKDDRPVVGFSCSGDHSADALMRLVVDVAQARPELSILVSGQIVHTSDRIAEIRKLVKIVPDFAAAEAEIARIEARLTRYNAPSQRARRGRSSAA